MFLSLFSIPGMILTNTGFVHITPSSLLESGRGSTLKRGQVCRSLSHSYRQNRLLFDSCTQHPTIHRFIICIARLDQCPPINSSSPHCLRLLHILRSRLLIPCRPSPFHPLHLMKPKSAISRMEKTCKPMRLFFDGEQVWRHVFEGLFPTTEKPRPYVDLSSMHESHVTLNTQTQARAHTHTCSFFGL